MPVLMDSINFNKLLTVDSVSSVLTINAGSKSKYTDHCAANSVAVYSDIDRFSSQNKATTLQVKDTSVALVPSTNLDC